MLGRRRPNIIGQADFGVGNVYSYLRSANRALYTLSQAKAPTPQSGTAIAYACLGLNVHNSNSMYTDLGKVYPLSLALNFIIKS